MLNTKCSTPIPGQVSKIQCTPSQTLKCHFKLQKVSINHQKYHCNYQMSAQLSGAQLSAPQKWQIGPRLSGAQLSAPQKWQIGPQTVGPRGPVVRGPICHFFRANSWARDNWAPSPFGICNDIFYDLWILFVIKDGISMFGMVCIVFRVLHLGLGWSILYSGWFIWYCVQWI